MIHIVRITVTLFFAQLSFLNLVHAWGRQGHSLIGETASRVIAKEYNFEILNAKSYDVGYYSNVPDFIWKRTEQNRKYEKFNHYMDLDIYSEKLTPYANGKIKEFLLKEFQLSRVEFNKKYSQIDNQFGRAFWRIREFEEKLTQISRELKRLGAPPVIREMASISHHQEKRFELQKDWLKYVGLISHYVGDLGQPLHVTANFDGQKNEQTGVHAYYEDQVVDQLTPALRIAVLEDTQKKWREFHNKNSSRTTLEILMQLTENSAAQIDQLLATDKRVGRSDLSKASDAHKAQITERMVEASLVLAEITSRQIDWSYDLHLFYNIEPEPTYIGYPGMK